MQDSQSFYYCILTCFGEVEVPSSFEMVWVKAEERNDVVPIPVSPLQHLHRHNESQIIIQYWCCRTSLSWTLRSFLSKQMTVLIFPIKQLWKRNFNDIPRTIVSSSQDSEKPQEKQISPLSICETKAQLSPTHLALVKMETLYRRRLWKHRCYEIISCAGVGLTKHKKRRRHCEDALRKSLRGIEVLPIFIPPNQPAGGVHRL